MKLRLFTIMLLLATGVAHSHPNAILGPAQSTDPSLLLASNPLLKTQLYWWCHNIPNNPGKKPQPVSLEGIVMGHWANRFQPNGNANVAHIIDHFASETEFNNGACNTIPTPPTPPQCTTNCGHISGAETFEFEIKMGGTDVNLYVCEVGFGPNFNTEGFINGDYMVITKTNGQDVTITGPNSSELFNQGDLDGSSAKVFLNSINSGASYFVRYCLNVERLIVGNPTFDSSKDIFSLNATAHAQVPLALTGYLSTVGLNTKIFHKCGSDDEVLRGNLNLEGFANLVTPGDYGVDTQDYLQMSTTSYSCSWKILFTQANHVIRPIINEGSTFIHTELNFELSSSQSN